MINVAVIGLGKMGRHHARVFARLQKEGIVRFVAASDMDESKKSLVQPYGCNFYTDYKEMIKDEKIDAISIVTPTHLHESVAIDCLNMKINALVEKPITTDLPGAERIIQAAQKNGVKLTVGHIERFNPAIQKLKELMENGEIGDLLSLSAKRISMPRIADAGVLIDLAIHDIDIMKWLTGAEVESVYAVANHKLSVGKGLEDYAHLTIHFTNGVIGTIEVSRLTPAKIREFSVTGTKAYCSIDMVNKSMRVMESFVEARNGQNWNDYKEFVEKFQPNVRTYDDDGVEPLYLELKSFAEAVRDGKSVAITAEDGKRALEIALKAKESYEKGAAVKL